MKPLIFAFTLLLLFTTTLVAQDDLTQSKRIHLIALPAKVNNSVGGNYIDSYVVHLQKGQKLHVQVENKTQHAKVSFDTVLAGTETRFGRDESENSWSGVAPETGDYEIRLIAFPAADYRLLVYLARDPEDDIKTASDRRVNSGVNSRQRAAYSYERRRRGK
jgi:hypothetical protein